MKKYLVSVLAIALVGASIAGIAQSAPMDHASHDMMGMDSSDMQAMQKKMSAAKTDEERQALMAEQHKLMQEKHPQMMPSAGAPQSMEGMPCTMAERQQMMHKHKGIGMGMMPM
jgi:hypothetical protein